MNHYTYIIQSKTTEMRYIGVRSSKCIPTEDIEYWGSSKHLPLDVRETHRKIIIKLHSTRKEAVAHEVSMHRINDVAVNPAYYNKARQLITGFDTSGVPMPTEAKARIAATLKGRVITAAHQAKITKALTGRTFSEEHLANLSKSQKAVCAKPGYVNPRKGVTLSAETRKRSSDTKKADTRPAYIKAPRFSPWYITDTINNVTHLFYTTTKQEYALATGDSASTYRDLATRCINGTRVTKRGKHKGLIVGNIPTVV